ncbi:MAG: RNA polymerase sigma factor [Planctomycetota bacterium]
MDGRFEKKLVEQCRRGDKSAYAGLVKAYTGRVFAICLGLLGNRHDAEDIAQQALLKGFAEIGELRDGDRFGAWIGRIARNLCIDLMRRRERKQNALGRRTTMVDSDKEEYLRLQAALGRLPQEYRVVLMLYYFDGQSTKNIAETLEISEMAVHTRLSRARKRLRKLLETEGVR